MPLPPWHPHLDVWVLVLLLGFGYLYAVSRIEPLVERRQATSKAQKLLYLSGVAAILVVSEWPIHDLAEDSLYSVHMVEHMVITLVAAPLMLAGLPRWLADRVFGNRRVLPIIRPLARPVAAFFIYNLGLVATHWPEAVALSLDNEPAHFLIHSFLFGSAILLWLPVLSTSSVLPRINPPIRILYLFLNTIIPSIPASFLTFSRIPIYPAYGDASWAFGISPVDDQTVAGVIMKLGGVFMFLGIIAHIWFRWAGQESRWDEIEQDLSTPV
jgi:putative membrane protein